MQIASIPLCLVMLLFFIVIVFIGKKEYVVVFTVITLIASIACFQTKYLEKQFKTLYQDKTNYVLEAIVVGNKQEKEYSNLYKMKIVTGNQTGTYLQVYVKKELDLEYGDKVEIKGEYSKPIEQRNYQGFDYNRYLKTKNIYGIFFVEEVALLEKNKVEIPFYILNQINISIEEKIEDLLGAEEGALLIVLLLGNTNKIEEELLEDFRKSNLSHVLAISGMHISYLLTRNIFFVR